MPSDHLSAVSTATDADDDDDDDDDDYDVVSGSRTEAKVFVVAPRARARREDARRFARAGGARRPNASETLGDAMTPCMVDGATREGMTTACRKTGADLVLI